jgi:hypothetical protein
MRSVLLLSAALLAISPAYANTGMTMRECFAPGVKPDAMVFCRGVLVGAADALATQGHICYPQGSRRAGVLALVKDYILAHPEALDSEASAVAAAATIDAWSCRRA